MICSEKLSFTPPIGISLIHIFKFAQYKTTSINEIPKEPYFLRGLIKIIIPKTISKNPLKKTQNLGSPSADGTIGSNHSGSIKCWIQIFIKNNPKNNVNNLLINFIITTLIYVPV
jgi:hypothetical protein